VTYRIAFAEPYIEQEDIECVARAVKERRLSQGEYVARFETEFARYVGVKHAVAVSSGTAALHVALAAVGVGPRDEVMVPSFSFIATANSVLYQNAKPVFADIDPLTYNVDPTELKRKITTKVKAIIPVHYAGQPCDMDAVREIAATHQVCIIEDAAEAHGALYKGRNVGRLGDVGCFSFYPNKNMTTAEGGMITTDNDEIAEKARLLRSHGQDRTYHHIVLGYNYRMTDIQAALGLVQLKRLDWIIERKVEAARYYDDRLSRLSQPKVKTPWVAPYAKHTYMFYPIRFESKLQRELILGKLEQSGVDTRIHFPPIHLQPIYRALFRYSEGFLPVTEKASETVLSLPLHPQMSPEQQDYVLRVIEGVATK
jgi:perosamine synthetase